MTQTPYEVRFNVAIMARDMLESAKNTEESAFYAKMEAMRETKPSKDEMFAFIDSNKPKMYDEIAVVRLASAIYDTFVSKNK